MITQPPNYREGFMCGGFDETCYRCIHFSQSHEQWLEKMGSCNKYNQPVSEYKRGDELIDKIYGVKKR